MIGIKVIRVLDLLAAFLVVSAAVLRVDGREAGGADEGGEDGAGEHFAGSNWLIKSVTVIGSVIVRVGGRCSGRGCILSLYHARGSRRIMSLAPAILEIDLDETLIIPHASLVLLCPWLVTRVSFSGEKCREAINAPRALIVGRPGAVVHSSAVEECGVEPIDFRESTKKLLNTTLGHVMKQGDARWLLAQAIRLGMGQQGVRLPYL